MADLPFSITQQGSDSRTVLMLLHGIGANEQSVAPLTTGADQRLNVISVRAPLQIGPLSFAWYPTTFGPNGPVIDAKQAEQGRRDLLCFIEQYRKEHDIDHLYLMGFSQGAIMAAVAALSAPTLIQGIVAFSGRFPDEFRGVVDSARELSETRLWIGHGTEDEKLPIQLGRSMRNSLLQFGAEFTYSEFSGGHQVTQEMLTQAHHWITSQLNAHLPVVQG